MKDYPQLIPELQKKDDVVDFLISYHGISDFRDDIKKMLKASPSFFKMLTVHTLEKYVELLKKSS